MHNIISTLYDDRLLGYNFNFDNENFSQLKYTNINKVLCDNYKVISKKNKI